MKLIFEFDSLQDVKTSLAQLKSLFLELETTSVSVEKPVENQAEPKPEPLQAVDDKHTSAHTKDSLSRIAVSMMDRGMNNTQLTELLQKYKVVSIPELPTDKYDAFAADLKALEATL